MEEKQRIELEELIIELEGYRGRHTELITIYAPVGSNINHVSNQVEQEKGTASNIKSKNTRSNVMDALEKISRHLKLYKQIPKNGLAIFCGNVSENEGQPDIKLWGIEPPIELKVKTYRCDQKFVLEPLKEMLLAREVWGLIVVDRKESTLGMLEGKNIKLIRNITSGVPGKQKAGGQSANRFKRIIEDVVKDFYKRTAVAVKEAFQNNPKLSGIILGGPGPSKEDFLKEGDLDSVLAKKIIGIKDIGYSDIQGLKELVDVSHDLIAGEAITKERELLKKFFTTLGKEPLRIAYKVEDVRKALELGAVDHLLISKSIEKDLVHEFEKSALNIDAKVTFISLETEEGMQFKNIGGLGAFLRFAIGDKTWQ